MYIGRDDEAGVGHAFGGGGCLPARRGREIGDAFTRLRVEHCDDRLARLVLRCRPTVTDRGNGRGITAVPQHDRIGVQRAGRRADARLFQLVEQRARTRAQRIGSQRDRRRLVVDRERRDGVGPAEFGQQPFDQPVGMRRARAEVSVTRRIVDARPARVAPRQRPQHTVHEPARATRHDIDGLANRRVRRNAVEQLERTEAQRGAHGRVELRHRPRRDRSQRVVEDALHPHRAVHERRHQRAVARREVRATQQIGNENV
jgi:hypothetical protein